MSLKKLNLGSGPRKLEGYINIDIRPEADPDIVHDVETGLPYKDNYFDEVRAWDFLEHIRIGKTIFVMEEIYRVLKPNGKLIVYVPSTDGRGAFQDPDHKSFWNINSWIYYCDDEHRRLYDIKAKFEVIELQDVVNSSYEINKVIHTKGELRAVK